MFFYTASSIQEVVDGEHSDSESQRDLPVYEEERYAGAQKLGDQVAEIAGGIQNDLFICPRRGKRRIPKKMKRMIRRISLKIPLPMRTEIL